jgi:23S rRNA (uracil1939-C5)-methyltransferase
MDKVIIENFAHNGYGVTHINNRVVFVENALPSEVVDIEIIQKKKSYYIAKAKNIVESSPFRVDPKCPYYGKCGGCDFQHIDYSYQLELKKNVLINILKRIGGIEYQNIDIISSNKSFNYRRRAKFQCNEKEWGFYKKESKDIVDISQCCIVDNAINDYIKQNSCSPEEIAVDDRGKINSKTMVLDFSFIKENLYLTYKSGAFVQVNKYINRELIKTVVDEVKKENIESLVDFFGGVGNFSIPLAALGIKTVNVDIDKKALYSFRKNLQRLSLDGIAKAKRANLNKTIDIDLDAAESVLIDPPRSGAKSVVQYILRIKPEFVFYISCEASTISRDLNLLKKDYLIEKVVLFDMFPQTHHFESFVKLKKR